MSRFFPGEISLFNCSAVNLENSPSARSIYASQAFNAPETNRSSFAMKCSPVLLTDDRLPVCDVFNCGLRERTPNLAESHKRKRMVQLQTGLPNLLVRYR